MIRSAVLQYALENGVVQHMTLQLQMPISGFIIFFISLSSNGIGVISYRVPPKVSVETTALYWLVLHDPYFHINQLLKADQSIHSKDDSRFPRHLQSHGFCY